MTEISQCSPTTQRKRVWVLVFIRCEYCGQHYSDLARCYVMSVYASDSRSKPWWRWMREGTCPMCRRRGPGQAATGGSGTCSNTSEMRHQQHRIQLTRPHQNRKYSQRMAVKLDNMSSLPLIYCRHIPPNETWKTIADREKEKPEMLAPCWIH